MSLFGIIQRLQGAENMAGGNHILIIDVANVDVFPELLGVNYNDPITVLAGTAFSRWDFTVGTLGFFQTSVTENGATGFRAEVLGIVAKNTPANEAYTQLVRKKRCILIFTDHNGHRRVVGTKKNPAILSLVKSQSGDNPASSNNNYVITYTWESRHEVPFYQSVVDLPETALVCSAGITSDFSADITTAKVNEPIIFTGSSVPAATMYGYDFGDNTAGAGSGPVTKAYKAEGIYTVQQNAGNAVFGAAVVTKPNYIAVTGLFQDKVLEFNGTTQYCLRQADTALDFGVGDFAYSFWIKPYSVTGEHYILDKMNSGFSAGIVVRQVGTDLHFMISHGSNQTTFSGIAANTLYHVVAQRIGGVRELWVNGVQATVNVGPTSGATVTVADVLQIGRRDTGVFYYSGWMSDLYAYNAGLSPTAIAELYNGSVLPFYGAFTSLANLVSVHRMGSDGDVSPHIFEKTIGYADLLMVNMSSANFISP